MEPTQDENLKKEKMKHTPGPWTQHVNSTEVSFDILGSDVSWVAQAHGHLNNLTPEIGLANAKLIASAPELLEALEYLVFTASKLWNEVSPIKSSDTITVTHPIIEAAKSAIKKATE